MFGDSQLRVTKKAPSMVSSLLSQMFFQTVVNADVRSNTYTKSNPNSTSSSIFDEPTLKDDKSGPVCTSSMNTLSATPPPTIPRPSMSSTDFSGITLIGPYPQSAKCQAEDLCLENTTIVLILRRLGCPLIREFAANIASKTASYRLKGIKMVVVSGDVSTASRFLDEVWNYNGIPLPVYHDPELAFFKAIGSNNVENWRILSPKVLKRLRSMRDRIGDVTDALHKNTRMLGGEVIFHMKPAQDNLVSQCDALTHTLESTLPRSNPTTPPFPRVGTSLNNSCGSLSVIHIGHESNKFEHTEPSALFALSTAAEGASDLGLRTALKTIAPHVITATSVNANQLI